MHTPDLSAWTHEHVFDDGNLAGERGTRRVVLITGIMMVVEILAGWWFNSMALLADGWHMFSHAGAIGISALAYVAARRHARDARFAFGAWKIEALAAFASALFLLGIAVTMVVGSVERLFSPQAIRFAEAIAVAGVGLAVNVICALILGAADDHPHGHDHHRDHGQRAPHGRDLNLRSAYLHVIADAATSVLAIAALLGGMLFGWNWLDPVMGIVGAVLVAAWARGLLRDTSRVLLDREMDHPVVHEIREAVGGATAWRESTRISDLHVWRVGRHRFAAIVSLVTSDPALTPSAVKRALARHRELAHISVEINACQPMQGSTLAAPPS